MRFNNAEVEDVSSITKHVEDAELKKTLSRYEHLSWEHFPTVKEKHMDDVIFEKYFVTPEEEALREEQELVKKMQALSAQMKYDEATKLGGQMMKYTQPQTKDDWNTALKCLQEMEKYAYATKIEIDMHPSKWDLTSPKN